MSELSVFLLQGLLALLLNGSIQCVSWQIAKHEAISEVVFLSFMGMIGVPQSLMQRKAYSTASAKRRRRLNSDNKSKKLGCHPVLSNMVGGNQFSLQDKNHFIHCRQQGTFHMCLKAHSTHSRIGIILSLSQPY